MLAHQRIEKVDNQQFRFIFVLATVIPELKLMANQTLLCKNPTSFFLNITFPTKSFSH